MFENLLQPFLEFDFMQRALWAAILISLCGAPVGVFMNFRRLSLLGDALGHAILPGVAIAYMMAGLSSIALFVGGVLAGLCVAALSALVSEFSSQREENSLAVFYLLSLSLGVILISGTAGSGTGSVDLMHILFGSVLSLSSEVLLSVALTSLFVLGAFLVFGRLLLFEAVDAEFGRMHKFPVRRVHFLFLFLLVISLVSAFQALGTLMALGLMLVPAAASRFFARRVLSQILLSFVFAVMASISGLLLSFHLGWPSGPAIVLCTGGIYLVSLVFGHKDGLLPRYLFRSKHQKHQAQAAATLALILGLFSFGLKAEAQIPTASSKIRVVASFSILAEMAKSIGGGEVTVVSLILPGVDAHTYSPKPQDLVELKKADVFIGNGLGFDSWSTALLKNSGFKGRSLFVGDRLPEKELLHSPELHTHHNHDHHHSHGHFDPHCWQDPKLGIQYLELIKKTLTEAAPDKASIFESRFQDLKTKITEIDRKTSKALASISAEKKTALSSHASFGYLARAYGLQFFSPKAGSSEGEVSAKRLAEIEKLLKDKQINAAFFEAGASKSELVQMIERYRLKNLDLIADSLTSSEGEAPTYLRLLEVNSNHLIEAFSSGEKL